MTKTFELRVQDELLHPDPRTRPHLRTLLEDRLFRYYFFPIGFECISNIFAQYLIVGQVDLWICEFPHFFELL